MVPQRASRLGSGWRSLRHAFPKQGRVHVRQREHSRRDQHRQRNPPGVVFSVFPRDRDHRRGEDEPVDAFGRASARSDDQWAPVRRSSGVALVHLARGSSHRRTAPTLLGRPITRPPPAWLRRRRRCQSHCGLENPGGDQVVESAPLVVGAPAPPGGDGLEQVFELSGCQLVSAALVPGAHRVPRCRQERRARLLARAGPCSGPRRRVDAPFRSERPRAATADYRVSSNAILLSRRAQPNTNGRRARAKDSTFGARLEVR